MPVSQKTAAAADDEEPGLLCPHRHRRCVRHLRPDQLIVGKVLDLSHLWAVVQAMGPSYAGSTCPCVIEIGTIQPSLS